MTLEEAIEQARIHEMANDSYYLSAQKKEDDRLIEALRERQMIGCLCWLWNYNNIQHIGILANIDNNSSLPYVDTTGNGYRFSRAARAEEFKFYVSSK